MASLFSRDDLAAAVATFEQTVARAAETRDYRKAVRELGWQPRAVEESIREAARFWMRLRDNRAGKGRNDPVRRVWNL